MSLQTFVQTHEAHNTKKEPKYKLWTLAGDVDNGEGYECLGTGCVSNSVPSSQFGYEPKTSLKNKVLKIIKRTTIEPPTVI